MASSKLLTPMAQGRKTTRNEHADDGRAGANGRPAKGSAAARGRGSARSAKSQSSAAASTRSGRHNSPAQRSRKTSAKSGSNGWHEPAWARHNDEQLRAVRICDLGVAIEGTPLEDRVEQLNLELERRGLRFRPNCWLSDDWFSPDGIPGIAIPFYLAHPRLARLERVQMFEVEGGTKEWCMRILRHEAGHAIDTAYRLHRRRRWREVFGIASQPYPDHYQPRPYSKSYVQHLDAWYAQSHPSEDFAETFAVWLKPRSAWRTQYAGWPAIKKLEYVDELMTEIQDKKPHVASRQRIDPVRKLRKTLGEHYEEKRARYRIGASSFFDEELQQLFSDAPEHRRRLPASRFLRRHRRELSRAVARWTGQYLYTIDQVLGELIDRCDELQLRLALPERRTKREALVMLTVQTMQYLHHNRHKVVV